MNLETFRASLSVEAPPEGLDEALQALWWDAKADWDKAHSCAQAKEDRRADWVHAYLHRKEGDLGNASYWYRKAGREVAAGDLEQEWTAMVEALLSEKQA